MRVIQKFPHISKNMCRCFSAPELDLELTGESINFHLLYHFTNDFIPLPLKTQHMLLLPQPSRVCYIIITESWLFLKTPHLIQKNQQEDPYVIYRCKKNLIKKIVTQQ